MPLVGDDIARSIRYAVTRSAHASADELLTRPAQQQALAVGFGGRVGVQLPHRLSVASRRPSLATRRAERDNRPTAPRVYPYSSLLHPVEEPEI